VLDETWLAMVTITFNEFKGWYDGMDSIGLSLQFDHFTVLMLHRIYIRAIPARYGTFFAQVPPFTVSYERNIPYTYRYYWYQVALVLTIEGTGKMNYSAVVKCT
jgi:hypothetical protein